jgi:protein subunit release factor A
MSTPTESPHLHVKNSSEAGEHRWQRVPPTEKRGRVQSSRHSILPLAGESVETSELEHLTGL